MKSLYKQSRCAMFSKHFKTNKTQSHLHKLAQTSIAEQNKNFSSRKSKTIHFENPSVDLSSEFDAKSFNNVTQPIVKSGEKGVEIELGTNVEAASQQEISSVTSNPRDREHNLTVGARAFSYRHLPSAERSSRIQTLEYEERARRSHPDGERIAANWEGIRNRFSLIDSVAKGGSSNNRNGVGFTKVDPQRTGAFKPEVQESFAKSGGRAFISGYGIVGGLEGLSRFFEQNLAVGDSSTAESTNSNPVESAAQVQADADREHALAEERLAKRNGKINSIISGLGSIASIGLGFL